MLNDAFFASVRASLFGGHLTQPQVDGMNAIDNAWQAYGDRDRRKEAYVLATAYHETAQKMQPIEEYGGTVYLKGKSYFPYYGRGLVQLTWRENYADWSTRLDVDLVKQPELALSWKYAGRILVQGMMIGTFTGKKLGDYITPGGCDFRNCRRIINGTDKMDLIAGYAAKFLAALEAAASAPQPIPVPVAPPPPPDVEAPYSPPLPGEPGYVPPEKPGLHPAAFWTSVGGVVAAGVAFAGKALGWW
jgi:putative chitinase